MARAAGLCPDVPNANAFTCIYDGRYLDRGNSGALDLRLESAVLGGADSAPASRRRVRARTIPPIPRSFAQTRVFEQPTSKGAIAARFAGGIPEGPSAARFHAKWPRAGPRECPGFSRYGLGCECAEKSLDCECAGTFPAVCRGHFSAHSRSWPCSGAARPGPPPRRVFVVSVR